MENTNELLKYAINYLSKFSSSRANLEKVLKNKVRKLNIEKVNKASLYNSIKYIISQLESKNLINDKTYSNSKISSLIIQGKSKLYIKSFLLKKGIESNLINQSLIEYDNIQPEWEIESAKTFARKKNLINDKKNNQKNLAKMSRAGFSYEISKKILDQI